MKSIPNLFQKFLNPSRSLKPLRKKNCSNSRRIYKYLIGSISSAISILTILYLLGCSSFTSKGSLFPVNREHEIPKAGESQFKNAPPSLCPWFSHQEFSELMNLSTCTFFEHAPLFIHRSHDDFQYDTVTVIVHILSPDKGTQTISEILHSRKIMLQIRTQLSFLRFWFMLLLTRSSSLSQVLETNVISLYDITRSCSRLVNIPFSPIKVQLKEKLDGYSKHRTGERYILKKQLQAWKKSVWTADVNCPNLDDVIKYYDCNIAME